MLSLPRFLLALIPLLLLGVVHDAVGQNLVPNPSFEIIDTCPSEAGDIRKAIPWYEPVFRSTDLFHECGEGDWVIGTNIRGFQYPDTGVAYAGIRTYAEWGENYREYLSVKLLDTLEKGMPYWISFKLNSADGNSVRWAIDEIGIYFTETDPQGQEMLNQQPQFVNPAGNFITNVDGWEEVAGCYVAEGNEAYLTLGNFKDDESTNILEIGPSWAQTSFYFVDDVSIVPLEDLGLGPDTLVCAGEVVEVQSQLAEADHFWSTGSEEASVMIEDPTFVTVVALQNDCLIRDSIVIDFREVPKLDLGQDTVLCEGETLQLDATIPQGSYVWQDSSQSRTFFVNSGGTYSVQARDSLCALYDTIDVAYWRAPELELGEDTAVCSDVLYTLDVSWEGASYDWLSGEDVPALVVDHTGLYAVTVSNKCGDASDSVEVELVPVDGSAVPNVVTPNGDGINDTFVVRQVEVCSWVLKVFNRWGQLVYQHENYDNSWSPESLNEGLYFFVMDREGETESLQGWITILK